jgi:hypothetical protein
VAKRLLGRPPVRPSSPIGSAGIWSDVPPARWRFSMLKWIVDAQPDPDHAPNKGAVHERRFFSADRAAKTFVREMVEGRYFVTVQTAPGVLPAWRMTSAEAYRWSAERDVPEAFAFKKIARHSRARALPQIVAVWRFEGGAVLG